MPLKEYHNTKHDDGSQTRGEYTTINTGRETLIPTLLTPPPFSECDESRQSALLFRMELLGDDGKGECANGRRGMMDAQSGGAKSFIYRSDRVRSEAFASGASKIHVILIACCVDPNYLGLRASHKCLLL
jgi:hypothetical protein